MVLDFTLSQYLDIVGSALDSGYKLVTVTNHFDGKSGSNPHIVMRHDVDRRPFNALSMAEGEADLGVQATYYFRKTPETFRPDIIKKIAGMGHEIGYHYEDFHVARYDADRAYDLFIENLAAFRALAPISTISMHGSPLSRFNNMEIWKYKKFEESNVKDCILSFDWSDYLFFTDTGRSFASGKANFRDKIGGMRDPSVRKPSDLVKFLTKRKADKIQLNVHPERWTNTPSIWVQQLAKDKLLNAIKFGLSIVRTAK